MAKLALTATEQDWGSTDLVWTKSRVAENIPLNITECLKKWLPRKSKLITPQKQWQTRKGSSAKWKESSILRPSGNFKKRRFYGTLTIKSLLTKLRVSSFSLCWAEPPYRFQRGGLADKSDKSVPWILSPGPLEQLQHFMSLYLAKTCEDGTTWLYIHRSGARHQMTETRIFYWEIITECFFPIFVIIYTWFYCTY